MDLASGGIFWDLRTAPPLQDLNDIDIEGELEKYVDCPKREIPDKRCSHLKVKFNSISALKLVCCALDMQGFKHNNEVMIFHDEQWEIVKSDVSIPGIITIELVEDVLVNLGDYFL